MIRTRFFTLRVEYVLTLLLMIALIVIFTARIANAETSRRVRRSTTTVTTVEQEGDDEAPPQDAAIPPPPPGSGEITENEVTTTFGSKAQTGTAGCKTEVLSKSVIKDLKKECKEWVGEQKSELGKRFMTSTCEDSCDDCGMNLVRCNVTGTVRYHKAQSSAAK